MASGTQQHQHQYQPQQPQHQQPSRQELPMSQQHKNQMQLATNQGLNACLDSQQSIHQMNEMSSGSMTLDPRQDHMMSINPYNQPPQPSTPQQQQQQQQSTLISPVMQPAVLGRDMCNQQTNQHHGASHLLPRLMSPHNSRLENSEPPNRAPDSDHDQIIDQVISLENDFSDPSAMTNVDNDIGMVVNSQAPHQQQLQHMSDTNFTSGPCSSSANQLSSSSEDLLNLLLEFDRDITTMVTGQQLDQDEKTGIETIRKQLMSCEMQSDHLQHDNSISPTLKQTSNSGHPHQVESATHQTRAHQIYQGADQLVPRTAPIMQHNQQQQQQPPQHQLSTPGLSQQRQQSQHHRLSVDQTMLQGTYSTNTRLGNTVPVSSSGHSYDTEIMSTISQSTPISIYNSSPSPSPSWQQPQLSPFSPQTPNNNPARPPPPQRQQQQHSTHLIESQQHPTATTASSHMQQQLHHPLQGRSPSQSLSPIASHEPSPVVKKNPLLNAQLVNSRAPSITPTRFVNNQTNVLNQNPILNSKLSQSTFAPTNSCNSVTSSTSNPNLNRPPQQHRYIQQQSPHQQQQSSSFSYDITQQQNAQQRSPPQTGYVPMYGHSDHQQQPNQIFRTSNASTPASSCIQPGESTQMSMSSTSPSGGGLSQQVKQEIRKKVQQPKQQHQTTSLLKQLLSDDNK